MNYIDSLKQTVLAMEGQNKMLRQRMIDFSAYLTSPKFTANPCEDHINVQEIHGLIRDLLDTMNEAEDLAPVRRLTEAEDQPYVIEMRSRQLVMAYGAQSYRWGKWTKVAMHAHLDAAQSDYDYNAPSVDGNNRSWQQWRIMHGKRVLRQTQIKESA